MKLIEAMKEVKANLVKINDLNVKIQKGCAHLDYETHEYPDPKGKVSEWLQSCADLSKRNIQLLLAIQKTNLATNVGIKIGDEIINRPIAYWIWRNREYAEKDLNTWSKLTDRGLKEGSIPMSTGGTKDVKIVRNFDPVLRDKMILEYKSEGSLIDAALEVANATTDLLE